MVNNTKKRRKLRHLSFKKKRKRIRRRRISFRQKGGFVDDIFNMSRHIPYSVQLFGNGLRTVEPPTSHLPFEQQ